MKSIKFLVLALANGFSPKMRRDVGPSFSLDGEEDISKLDSILAQMTNGTVDEIEAAIMANTGLGLGLGRREPATPLEERKFRNLKILVLYLQKEKQFGRYCYYGCHCLPEGSHNLARGGYGIAKDEIDQSCKRFGQCYKCLLEEHKNDSFDINGVTECRGEEIGYQATLADGIITCDNKPGSCRRNICECDKQLAENLALHEDNWNENFHSRRSGFDRDADCEAPVGLPSVKFEECCGTKKTFPLNEPRNSAQCCVGPKSYPNGQC